MTTVTILPISNANSEQSYRAISGDRQSVGKTAGEALDALTDLIGETNFSALLVIQNFRPDQFFSAAQQKRLSELMSLWRASRDKGEEFPKELQQELESLVETEFKAATDRTASIIQQMS